MPGVRAEFGVAADPEGSILAARRHGMRFHGAGRYRAASWFRDSATEMFRARKKATVKGTCPSWPRRAKKEISYLVICWFGYPKRIQYADDRIDGVEVNALIESEFSAYEQEIPGSMYFSWDHNLKNQITIFGEKGVVEVLENDDSSVFVTKEINGNQHVMEIRNHKEKEKVDLFARQLDYFLGCIEKKINVPEPTVFALETVRFVEQCYRNRLAVRQPWVDHGIDENRSLRIFGGVHGK